MQKLINQLIEEFPKKRIETKVIERFILQNIGQTQYHIKGDYLAFAESINQLVNEDVLRPIKARKENGMNPALYNWYQIIRPEDTLPHQKQHDLLLHYHPRMNMTYYLEHSKAYQEDKTYLIDIDRYFRQMEKSTTSISINERSFAIFRDEKFLASSKGRSLLQRLGLSLDDFNCFITYEPFFYYQANSLKDDTGILIVENKDTFFSLKILLQEGICLWDGQTINLLIYGEGRKILRSFSFLEELYPQLPKVKCFYFGDLDPEGIQIWHELKLQESLEIIPFVSFYNELIERYQDKAPRLRTNQRFYQRAIDEFLGYFSPLYQQKIQSILTNKNYLPQEGLSLAILRELGGLKDA